MKMDEELKTMKGANHVANIFVVGSFWEPKVVIIIYLF